MPDLETMQEAYKDGWQGGGGETVCGRGSMLRWTNEIRENLPCILKKYDVKVVTDAGCGDFNWVKEIDWSGIDYMGVDLIDRTPPDGLKFEVLDITQRKVRYSDLIICRDVFIHLSNTLVLQAISLFKESGSKLLLTSSYPDADNQIRPDSHRTFRPINLESDPFDFGDCIEEFEEPSFGRFMRLWYLKSLRCKDAAD